jgi:hypothetical protein
MKNVHKLGTSRAGELSRLWLEGPRLIEAGFKHKLGFKRTVSENKMVLEIVNARAWEELPRSQKGTVAGSPDRPIIDITGSAVVEAFNRGFEQVTVNYLAGRIVVIPYVKES